MATNNDNKVTIAKEGGIQRILKSMNEHASSAAVQEKGCMALRNLSANNDNNKVTIAKEGGIQRIYIIIFTSSAKKHSLF